jgi:4-hydroxythreonine-4-phosphate dehydrogenase
MPSRARSPLVVVTTGCPSGIGPEVSIVAASRIRGLPMVLVGDIGSLRAAAKTRGIAEKKLVPFDGSPAKRGTIPVLAPFRELLPRERTPGKPGKAAGAAQLAFIDAGYALAKANPGSVLVTAPVSKEQIAHSGARGAARFVGHTEWLRDLDGAKASTMCFVSKELATSLVTTHVPIARVPKLLTRENVAEASVRLVELLERLGKKRPHIAVASLNPHAGEGEMFGVEETRAIAPGVALAAARLGSRARFTGPIGAETAYRKHRAGAFDGVVAMYHDQATIPMKLIAFGDAVNVTMGLSLIRTSVDHGTAYDIAGKGVADASGMIAAIEVATKTLPASR